MLRIRVGDTIRIRVRDWIGFRFWLHCAALAPKLTTCYTNSLYWSESCREHDGTGFAALIPAHGHNAPDTVRQRTGLPPTLGQGLGLRLVFGRTGHIHDTGPDPGPDPDPDPDPDRNPDSDLLYLTLVLTRCT